MQSLWHVVDAVHATGAVGVVDGDFLLVSIVADAVGWAAADDRLDWEPSVCISSNFCLVYLDVVSPGTDDRNIGTCSSGYAVVRAAGSFDFGFVWPHWAMQFHLIMLGDIVGEVQSVIACEFATARTYAAAWGSEVRTGTTKVPTSFRQVVEARLQMIGGGTKEDNVTGCTVHVGDTGAVLVPNVAQGAQVIGFIEETGWLVDTHGVEFGNCWIFFRL